MSFSGVFIKDSLVTNFKVDKDQLKIKTQNYAWSSSGFNPWLNSVRIELRKGAVWLGQIDLTAYPECCGACIIHNLVVGERRKKNGTLLLQMAEFLAKQNDYSVIHGIIPQINKRYKTDAIKFFEKQGYIFDLEHRVKNKNTGNWLVSIHKEI